VFGTEGLEVLVAGAVGGGCLFALEPSAVRRDVLAVEVEGVFFTLAASHYIKVALPI
jgi:hypothetical protein